MQVTTIKKIILSNGKRDIELSEEEARSLYNALDGLFGKKVSYFPACPYKPNPYWWSYGTATTSVTLPEGNTTEWHVRC